MLENRNLLPLALQGKYHIHLNGTVNATPLPNPPKSISQSTKNKGHSRIQLTNNNIIILILK